MVVLEDGFSDNDKYLLNEYFKHKSFDFLLTELGDKPFVVPYKYTVGSHVPQTSKKRFIEALLDFENIEIGKYKRAGLSPKIVKYNGRDFVVPFNSSENLSPKQLANRCFDKAFAKYNAVINAVRELDNKGYPVELIDFSTTSLNKYSKRLVELGSSMVLDSNTPQKVKMVQILQQNDNKKITKFNTSPKSLKKQVATQVIKQEKKLFELLAPKYYKAAVVASLLGVGAAVSFFSDKKTQPLVDDNTNTSHLVDEKFFVDFTGEKHIDNWGNYNNIQKLKPEISALLLAVEGFADNAFYDGGGTLTIGTGSTFYLDTNGSVSKIKKGDKISPEMAMTQKWRYIDKYMASIFGDKLGREASSEELLAGIGAGFCWGPNGLESSSFFKSLQDCEDLDTQINKISGFRKQKGLLKRGYLLACCLSGEWSAQDLLDLPVYYLEGKGYVNCSIYNLELHDILPCHKDKNGRYLKDKDGNNLPKIKKDGFCYDFYLDRAQIIKNKLIQDAKKSKTPYVTVRDLMPQNLLAQLENKHTFGTDKSLAANFSKFYKQRD